MKLALSKPTLRSKASQIPTNRCLSRRVPIYSTRYSSNQTFTKMNISNSQIIGERQRHNNNNNNRINSLRLMSVPSTKPTVLQNRGTVRSSSSGLAQQPLRTQQLNVRSGNHSIPQSIFCPTNRLNRFPGTCQISPFTPPQRKISTRVNLASVWSSQLQIRKFSKDFKKQASNENIDLEEYTPERIRTFSVIAHIDHGKTSLSKCLVERTKNTIPGSETSKNETAPDPTLDLIGDNLDNLKVEQERGITIKAHTCSLFYRYPGDDQVYLLNLIDTPGHVDFGYEVSRALSACDGTCLVVDASQGVQAQTMANGYLALEKGLKIVPILNKVDMNSNPASLEKITEELEVLFDIDGTSVIYASAKTGQGIDQILESIVEIVPPPKNYGPDALPKAFLFDSWFDRYRGVICLITVKSGSFYRGQKLTSCFSKNTWEIQDLGILHANQQVSTGVLHAGQVGYMIAGMKSTKEAAIGDTFHLQDQPVDPEPGFKESKPMVFAGIFPVNSNELEKLRDSIEKLRLTDSSIRINPRSSDALGLGFHIGFLGVLHMEVFMQRLEQEYDLEVIATAPSVRYRVIKENGDEIIVENASDIPATYQEAHEPWISATILVPADYMGPIVQLCGDRRGEQLDVQFLDDTRVVLRYKLPLAEVLCGFYTRLKELTAGYGQMEYEDAGYEKTDLCKLSISLNGDPVDALSVLCHRAQSRSIGVKLVTDLAEQIDRHLFAIAVQASVGSKVIARESIKPFRKDVTAKCYGGDVSRKKKLLEKQKAGKRRMKAIGKVNVPQEAFFAVLKRD